MRSSRRHRGQIADNRSGITWVDVVVVVIILLVLAAVFLPAMRDVRPAARRIECQNNMKQLVTATLNHSFKKKGQLPWIYEVYDFGTEMETRASWAVELLPELDYGATLRDFRDEPREFQRHMDTGTCIKQLYCPADEFYMQKGGGLSYVANAGYIRADIYDRTAPGWQLSHALTAVDWDRSGTIDDPDLQTAYSTGVFWPPMPDAQGDDRPALLKQPMTLDYIAAGDGQSSTILFTENKQARNWHRADGLHDFAFGVPVDPARDFVGADKAQRLAFKPSLEKSLHAQNALPDENPKADPGTAARPSSNHRGVVIVGFADGSAKQVSTSIDWSVYVRLLTPNGREYGQPAEGTDNY